MRAALAALLLALALAPAAADGEERVCPGDPSLGRIAYLRGGALHVVDLGTCADRTLVSRGAFPPVRFSPSGSWIAFGAGAVVSAQGGRVLHPLGGRTRWVWSPTEDVLAGVTPRGGLVLTRPGGALRRLLPDGWDTAGTVFDPSGQTLAVARGLPLPPRRQEIWLVRPETKTRELVYSVPPGEDTPPLLTGWSPDGRWILFWPLPDGSNSIAADGLPLLAKRTASGVAPTRVVPATLLYPEFLAWCGPRLVVAEGGGRYTTDGKRLVVVAPTLWTFPATAR